MSFEGYYSTNNQINENIYNNSGYDEEAHPLFEEDPEAMTRSSREITGRIFNNSIVLNDVTPYEEMLFSKNENRAMFNTEHEYSQNKDRLFLQGEDVDGISKKIHSLLLEEKKDHYQKVCSDTPYDEEMFPLFEEDPKSISLSFQEIPGEEFKDSVSLFGGRDYQEIQDQDTNIEQRIIADTDNNRNSYDELEPLNSDLNLYHEMLSSKNENETMFNTEDKCSQDNNRWHLQRNNIDTFSYKIQTFFLGEKREHFEYPVLLPHLISLPLPYVKVTRKGGKIPFGVGINKELGVFLHLKKKLGTGNFKKAFSAQWIMFSGEILPVVYKKLIPLKDNFKMNLRVKWTEKELAIQDDFEHESIVKLYSYDIYDNCKNIAIYEEACDCTLHEIDLDYGSKLTIAIDVVRALIYLHSKGYAHNDIKLKNILIKDLRGKLGDFGHCRKIGSEIRGYVKTYSPEQRAGKKIGTDKTDVYQLGLCLWHLFHPNPPNNHMYSGYQYPCSMGQFDAMFVNWYQDNASDLGMKALVSKCLSPNPNERPSMTQVKNDLLEIQKLF